MSLKKLVASIKRNKYFLITTHTNPEGDALGSELAFYRLLKKMGKRPLIINDDDLSCAYNFLPGINKIKKFKTKQRPIRFDCFVILDCSDLRRCGEVSKINIYNKPIINIDHHISNERFGDINWVEPHASSCSEMIYKLYKKLRIPLDKEIAMLLYVGILTDTGSFHYPNTTPVTHRIVSELLKYNLNISQIYKNAYENIPFKDMQLLSQILPTIRCELQGKIAWFTLKRNIFGKQRLSIDLSEQLLSFARAIKDVEVAVLFKENLGAKGEVRVNFRSQGKIDVNRIAQAFGGGGHKTASGATVKGRIEEVRRRVLSKIRESFK
jgi:phosphoesterase RecJ-like protein